VFLSEWYLCILFLLNLVILFVVYRFGRGVLFVFSIWVDRLVLRLFSVLWVSICRWMLVSRLCGGVFSCCG